MASVDDRTSGPARERLRELVAGYRVSQLIHAAVTTGLIESLRDGPRSAAELALACRFDPHVLARVLPVLTKVGVLAPAPGGRVGLGALGELLRRDAPDSLAAWTETVCQEQYLAWSRVADTIRTGQPAFPATAGSDFWSYLDAHPTARVTYQAGMAQSAQEAQQLLLDAADMADVRWVVDLGGGDGSVATALLRTHPRLRAVILDRPVYQEVANDRLEAGGVADRATFTAADFRHDPLPAADMYLLCRVLSDWDDTGAGQLLSNCRRALGQGGRLLVVDGLADPDRPAARGLLDLHLRVVTGGRERTEAELRALLADAGLAVTAVQHGPARRLSLVQCAPR